MFDSVNHVQLNENCADAKKKKSQKEESTIKTINSMENMFKLRATQRKAEKCEEKQKINSIFSFDATLCAIVIEYSTIN